MASATRYFGIGYFDFGDPLGSDFSGQIEIDRFVFLDKMLFGLMSIFGNGVVDGWVVSAGESFTVSISEGFGNIDSKAARTTFPFVLRSIPPNSTVYVYAKARVRTSFTEEVEFIFDTSSTLAESNFNFLLLASVTTGTVSVESVDNSIRQEIGFIELIKAAIRLHKHRGGDLNPSKIDLASEVKGQLPSFRIADFDAEKITTGTLDLERLPLIDHQDLQNVGLLTHPQLDTFVKTLESNNTELFGEIGTSNLLQLIIAAKLIYEDADSAFYTGTQIDENMINELVVIPGITPNSRIDFNNSTAEIDLDQKFIKGVPPTTGTSFFVTYDTALAWEAQTLENLVLVGDTLTLDFDPNQNTTTQIIEGFESATTPNQDLSDTGAKLFTRQTKVLVDNAEIISNASSTNIEEGFYSGKFTHQQSFRMQFVKQFSTIQDWTSFDAFSLSIKCLSSTHGTVKMFFADSTYSLSTGSGNKSTDYTLLDQDEVTDGFEARDIDLTTINFRDKIKYLIIFSDDLINSFNYFIDNMRIEKALLLPEEGTMRLRYASGSSVTFSTLEWSSTEPPGTEIEVRARSANGSVLLNRATFTDFLANGDNINLEGTDIEIEFTFLPNSERTVSPVLESTRLLILTDAELDGFTIDSSEEFSRGESANAVVDDDTITLDTPIYVDSIYFALQNKIHQGNMAGSAFVSGNEPSILGTNDSPIAPNQVFKAVEESRSGVARGLFEPRSVVRQDDRSFIVADTFNDRVLEFDEDGVLLSGVGSINYETNTTFPLAASLDIRTNILYLIWSKKISFKTVNVSKITIQTNTEQVHLIKDFDKILGLTTTQLSSTNAEGQILPIYLSPQNASILQLFPRIDTYLQVDGDATNGVIPGGIDETSIFYSTVASGLGIPCYIGNFLYIDGIFTPTYANRSLSNGLLIANGTIAVKAYNLSGNPKASGATVNKVTTVSSVLELDNNNNVVFGSNIMNFSPFIPGRIEEIDKTTVLIGGIRPGGESGTPSATAPLNFRAISGTDISVTQQKETLNQIFFGSADEDKRHVGSVIIYDRSLNSTTFEYVSAEGILVSDVDRDSFNQYVVAESSIGKSGRVIKLDTNGNVVFSFGEGTYGLINDINVQWNDSIVIST